MRRRLKLGTKGCILACMTSLAFAASKPHVVALGKSTSMRLLVGPGEDKPLDLKVRPLYVDGKLIDYTFGQPHDVTERLFVVRRIVRVNDALPQENIHWSWQRSGWLVVDRVSARTTQVMLSEFDPDYSPDAWFRDYIAYCGISDDGKKVFALVAQLGRRKAILKKPMNEVGDSLEGLCAAPVWQRQPTRVTFAGKSGEKFTYQIHRRSVEAVTEDNDEGSD